jgi:prolyl-tRNA synthetase
MSDQKNNTAKQALPQNAISPRRTEDFPEWYQQVVKAADMAENSEVRGCMVIKPWGYGVWEQVQSQMDKLFKKTGHKNAYFPLLIPVSYMEREASHVEGFATECAVVTHHRLEAVKQPDGSVKMKPAGELAEPYIIRPTSETIIGAAFARWVSSYRDLPLLINQWCNVMRWEMRPRLFLRTAEFLWQEGHTAHETADEAVKETLLMLDVYESFMRDQLALPVIKGEKTEAERFPGAVSTYCVETMVQDRKAIQAGTSHFLGQNFAKACGIQFQGRSGSQEHAWTTSWGVSTRMIGTMIMTHADDDGMIMPPRIAPTHVVIVPITPKEDTRDAVLAMAHDFAKRLGERSFAGREIEVEVDARDKNGGEKSWEWIKKGVPVRIEIGPRDMQEGKVALARRDRAHKQKDFLPVEEALEKLPSILQEIQDTLLARAREHQNTHMKKIDTLEEFKKFFTPTNEDKPEIHGGFALCHWAGSKDDEAKIKADLKVTIRCVPFADSFKENGTCFVTGKPSKQRVIFSKSY